MTTGTSNAPRLTMRLAPSSPHPARDLNPADVRYPADSLGSAIGVVARAVDRVPLDDPRWDTLGPLLTTFVDAARRAVGRPGSPIRTGEAVAPVLRLRDLGRLAQLASAATGRSAATATAEVEDGLRCLRDAGFS